MSVRLFVTPPRGSTAQEAVSRVEATPKLFGAVFRRARGSEELQPEVDGTYRVDIASNGYARAIQEYLEVEGFTVRRVETS